MLIVLAVVAAKIAAIAHYVPVLNLVVTVLATIVTFGRIGIFILKITGIIDDSTFQKTLDGF